MQRMLPRYWEKKGLWPTKKQLENYCLRNVLAYNAHDDYTRREIERLNSLQRIRKLPVTNTWDIERPDFLFRDPTNKKRIIGIEHFEANKMSKEEPAKKKKKQKGADTVISSYGKVLNKQIFNMIKTHKNDVCYKNNLTENMLNALSNHLENELNFAEQSSVATLTDSIRHSLDLHFSHINEYIKNIQKEFVDVEDIELNFMFDITSDFYGRFLQLPNMFFDGWNILTLYNNFIDLLDDFNNKQTNADGNSINPRLISNFIINVHDHHNKMYEVLIIPNQNVKEYIETQLRPNGFINTKMFCVSNLCHNFKVEYKKVPNGVVEYFSYDAFAYNCQWQKIYNSNQTKQLLVEMKKCIFKEPQLIFIDHNIWLMFCMEYPIEAWLILDMVEWYKLQQYRYLHMGRWYKN